MDEKDLIMGCSAPDLSIVIALIAGRQAALTTCLEALEASARLYRVECIVPYDARLDGVEELVKKFPWVDFVDARAEGTRSGCQNIKLAIASYDGVPCRNGNTSSLTLRHLGTDTPRSTGLYSGS